MFVAFSNRFGIGTRRPFLVRISPLPLPLSCSARGFHVMSIACDSVGRMMLLFCRLEQLRRYPAG